MKSLHFLNKVFSVFLLNKMLLNMTLLLQNFARIQNMSIWKTSNDHRRRHSSPIKNWWLLLWRTQNPTITRYLWIWGHSPIIWKFAQPKPTFCTKNNSTTLKVVLRPEPKVLNPWFWSEIRSMGKRPLSGLKIQNAILVWYLNENGRIWDIWGHISLK